MGVKEKEKLKILYQDENIVENYEKQRKFRDGDISFLHEVQIAGLKEILKGVDGSVLEIAVGTARIARNLQNYAFPYVGLDYSFPMLIEARKALSACYGRFFLVRGDAFCLPIKREIFNAVLSFRFLQHLKKQDRVAFYEGVREILKKDSLFVFDFEQNKDLRKKFLPDWRKSLLNEYFKELTEYGFKEILFLGYRYGFFKFLPKFLSDRRLFIRIISWLERRCFNRYEFLRGRCRGGIIVCKKV